MRHHLKMMQELHCSLNSMLVSNPGLLINVPTRFDSLTPLINKSASLSINSMISYVSLQSCSFTVCFRVSSTSNLSSCVRYFMLSVL